MYIRFTFNIHLSYDVRNKHYL